MCIRDRISSPGWAGAYPWINKHDKVYGFFISHVAGSSAKEDGFSSFFGSPVISRTVSEILKGKPLVVKQGRINVGNGSLYSVSYTHLYASSIAR